MSSSVFFKSICTAAVAILASSRVASAQSIGNWDILFTSLETDFQDSVTNELTLDYLIGTGRQFNLDLFTKYCISPITGMSTTPTTARMSNVDADHDEHQGCHGDARGEGAHPGGDRGVWRVALRSTVERPERERDEHAVQCECHTESRP